MAKITLTGFMGSGKTKLGKILSNKLGIPHFDLDEEIERRENKVINEIFHLLGEKKFREIEKNLLKEFLDKDEDLILSLGGGAILDKESRDYVLKKSIPILLKGDLKIFYERIKNENTRPLSGNFYDFVKLYKKREKIYNEIPIKVRSDREENLVISDLFSLFKKIEINEPQKIFVEFGKSFEFKKNYFLFSILDEMVFEIYKDRFKLKNFYLIEKGEKSKTLNEYFKIINFLTELKFEKNNSLYVIGGGVVGDLGGFVASTYMRGIKFYLIPTTLISQIDSSIGGKNGVNLKSGKNLVGTIYLPEEIIIDPSFLFTLNRKEIQSGLGEIFKYSILRNNGIFNFLEEKESLDFFEIINLILPSIEEKNFWIKEDLFERENKRIFLNFGHTTGHMLETLFGYGKISHGEAVSFGIVFSSFVSLREKLIKECIFNRILNVYKKLGFNYKKFLKIKGFKDFDFYNALLLDKKSKNKKLNLIVPIDLGNLKILNDFEIEIYLKYLKEFNHILEELWKKF